MIYKSFYVSVLITILKGNFVGEIDDNFIMHTIKTSEEVLFMNEYFDICGTHIAISAIKDFRTIQVEFIFRPVFRESKKSLVSVWRCRKMKMNLFH